ncbi:MAG: glutamate racemase [Desulfobacterales bacterium]
MIGIFDSGIGGLTVARALMDLMPGYNIVYFGDTARTPYGSKSFETVRSYALEDTEFLIKKGAKMIVIACNSVSSVATHHITARFSLPIFEVITPAVETAVAEPGDLKIGVIGTRATINSGIYERKIMEKRPNAKVYSVPCPLLVPLVEEGWLDKPETRMILKKYLHPLKMRQITALILGCTHYPILSRNIRRKIGKRANIIDSSIAISEKVRQYLLNHPDLDESLDKGGVFDLYVSDVTSQFEKTAKYILRRNVTLKQAHV